MRDPVWESGANARAITQFGFNSAQVFAFSGPDPSAQNDVVDSAAASSLWVDDWTFSVLFGAPVPPIEAVSVDIELDALWQNTGQLVFEAAIVDTTLPPIVDPDDPDPFLDLDGRIVSRVAFDSTAPFASTGVPPIRVPILDGGEPGGDLLLPLTLSFVPELGRTYQIGARLIAIANGEADEEFVPRGFATVRRIVLPHPLVHFDSAGRSSSLWNVVVPEPATAWLLALAGCALALARRRAA